MITYQDLPDQRAQNAESLDKAFLYSIMHHAMKKTQIYLPKDQFFQLKHLATVQQTSYADLVRRAIDEYLKKDQKQRSKAFSWAESAEKYAVSMGGNVASRIDDILYGKYSD